jgi:DNA-binding IclR family transcriptional regulator
MSHTKIGFAPEMTKLDVLSIFANIGGYLKPDNIINQLRPVPDRRSFYSYLGRLQRQGLLERHPNSRRGYLAYRLTPRGQARLDYFRKSGSG